MFAVDLKDLPESCLGANIHLCKGIFELRMCLCYYLHRYRQQGTTLICVICFDGWKILARG